MFSGLFTMFGAVMDTFALPCLVLYEALGVFAHVQRTAGLRTGRSFSAHRGLSLQRTLVRNF